MPFSGEQAAAGLSGSPAPAGATPTSTSGIRPHGSLGPGLRPHTRGVTGWAGRGGAGAPSRAGASGTGGGSHRVPVAQARAGLWGRGQLPRRGPGEPSCAGAGRVGDPAAQARRPNSISAGGVAVFSSPQPGWHRPRGRARRASGSPSVSGRDLARFKGFPWPVSSRRGRADPRRAWQGAASQPGPACAISPIPPRLHFIFFFFFF